MIVLKIQCKELSFLFGETLALDSLNLNIDSNRIAILGQNGSGKTTLLALISGLLSPTEGEILIDGVSPYKERERSAERFHSMFGVSRYPYRMLVREFLQYLKSIRKIESPKHKMFETEILGPIINKRMNALSSGEVQLVTIVNAIYNSEGTLILDEPFAFLDAFRSSLLIDYLVENKEIDYVLSTHNPEEAEGVGDYFVILDRGKIKWKGTLEDLYQEGIFEIYLDPRIKVDFEFIFKYGNIALVKITDDHLNRLMADKEILGFRRAGIRRVYYETE
ncbi:MAG: ATP-binding cassette domain-containing protein [Thermoplasmataceae archaeon]